VVARHHDAARIILVNGPSKEQVILLQQVDLNVIISLFCGDNALVRP